jgi:hypothetical protein
MLLFNFFSVSGILNIEPLHPIAANVAVEEGRFKSCEEEKKEARCKK